MMRLNGGVCIIGFGVGSRVNLRIYIRLDILFMLGVGWYLILVGLYMCMYLSYKSI